MLLAIDVGNTNSVFSIAKNKEIVSEWRCSTDGNMTADQYFTWLQQLFSISNIEYKDIKGQLLIYVTKNPNITIKNIFFQSLRKLRCNNFIEGI